MVGRLKSAFAFTKSDTEKPGVGFVPTPAMTKRHVEEAKDYADHDPQSQQDDRPLFQYLVTKLRTWRTGCPRILCLYATHFCTLDPDDVHHTRTNTWSYADLTQWLALPKETDCLLLEAVTEGSLQKLKFKCRSSDDRAVISTNLLKCKFQSSQQELEQCPMFLTCARQTRHGTRSPFGICEWVSRGEQQHHCTQTYLYTDIVSVSFTADDPTGLVLHFSLRLFFIASSRRGGNGRSDMVTLLRDFYQILGLELTVKESISTPQWLDQRRQFGLSPEVGPPMASWRMTKYTPRHGSGLQQRGTLPRNLSLTRHGYLLESDVGVGGGVVSVQSLANVHGLVRHASSLTGGSAHELQLGIEFANGQRAYLFLGATRFAHCVVVGLCEEFGKQSSCLLV